MQVVQLAHQSGSLVGLTAGDAHVVSRHYSEIWQILSQGIDILFANRYLLALATEILQIACPSEYRADLHQGDVVYEYPES